MEEKSPELLVEEVLKDLAIVVEPGTPPTSQNS
jgi:hypothetical protein